MNIEEAIENLKIYMKLTNEQIENGELFLDSIVNTEKIQIKSIETLLTAYEKEKEKNEKIDEFIENNLALLSEKDRQVMIRDLENAISYGDDCDEKDWKRLLAVLKGADNI